MDWRIKGTIQKVLGFVPGGGRIHHLLQRRGGGLANFERECDIKIDDWRLMMGHLKASRIRLAGATLLEMGSGWYPTFPFCLYLAGAERVITVDLNRHMRDDMTLAMVDRLAHHVPLIARESGLREGDIEARRLALAFSLRHGETIGEATHGSIEYRAPADAAKTFLPSDSVDVVFSNSVLEHVPGPVIEACLAESMRILKPRGIVFHSVNCGDHYAYADRGIHQLHYLQFSDRAWRKWNNAFLYQNRLRAIDFTDMAKRAGFAIEIDTSRPHPERMAQLAMIEVHPSFARYTREQLAITSIDFVGRKL